MIDKPLKVYIAGPYSSNPEHNTEEAIFYGDWIESLGHWSYIPHLTHYWNQQIHHEYEFWMKHDEEALRLCDAVFRMEGESSGADREVKLAQQLGIPVYYHVSELVIKKA